VKAAGVKGPRGWWGYIVSGNGGFKIAPGRARKCQGEGRQAPRGRGGWSQRVLPFGGKEVIRDVDL